MNIQNIIVAVIVATSVYFTLRATINKFKKPKKECGSCKGCPLLDECKKPEKK